MAVKRIPTSRLRPGMYVADLQVSWMDHPFWSNSFKVQDKKTLDAIVAAGIKELDIDTAKGLDVAPERSDPEPPPAARPRPPRRAAEEGPVRAATTFQQEIGHATQIQQEASEVAVAVMEDVRLGRQVSVEKVSPVVSRMVDSVFRNKDALMSLGLIRHMDQYTFEHSVSVAVLMISFAKELGIDPDAIQEIGVGALLHDIGKIKVPDAILNKPGRLTEEEFAVMRQHVVHSRDILDDTPGIGETALRVAAEHHERFDGSGYPDRLAGDAISRVGQMAAIVDVYDALTADRIYHQGQHPTLVLRRVLEWSKTQFNPGLTQRFIQCVGIYPVGTLVRLESGRLAVVVQANPEGLLTPVVRVVYDTRQRRFITPRLLDLADQPLGHAVDAIAGTEEPKRWAIKPEVFVH